MAIGYTSDGSANAANLSALTNTDAAIISRTNIVNAIAASDTSNVLRPEVFYDTQLLDTIRDAAESYQYFKYAKPLDTHGAEKLTLRRWAPLQAHTTPLEEGIPPMTDKGSVEKYEISAGNAYGRYMAFTDQVDFRVVDPVIAHYTSEYAIVAVETLDLLARDTLLTLAQKYFAGGAADLVALTNVDATPALADFRLIGLALKKAKVKPVDGTYHVMVSPEFVYDMLDDPYVQNYMRINNTVGQMYDAASDIVLMNMFGFSFHEVVNCPTSTAWFDSTANAWKCIVVDASGNFYVAVADDAKVSGYVKDARTGKDASYIPNQISFATALGAGETTAAAQAAKLFAITSGVAGDDAISAGASKKDVKVWKVNHILILGDEALVRTTIEGQDQAKMYIKPLGSAGVLDPIDQRQSIGFKINRIGFGSIRLEAIVDYICVPTQTNI